MPTQVTVNSNLITILAVGDAKVSLHFWREGEQTQWEVTHIDGELNYYT
ncbi:MAG: hypothetical protein VKL59_09410 [Nostocaceae cyanobacterium]|nr:hypothetical protein [Nostocaceae cyanobacterium]